jgi:hypothetical protein
MASKWPLLDSSTGTGGLVWIRRPPPARDRRHGAMPDQSVGASHRCAWMYNRATNRSSVTSVRRPSARISLVDTPNLRLNAPLRCAELESLAACAASVRFPPAATRAFQYSLVRVRRREGLNPSRGHPWRVSRTQAADLWCCTEDGSRPPEAGLQEQASNHPVLLRSKGVVVSDRANVIPSGVAGTY